MKLDFILSHFEKKCSKNISDRCTQTEVRLALSKLVRGRNFFDKIYMGRVIGIKEHVHR